jgi:spore coat protein I
MKEQLNESINDLYELAKKILGEYDNTFLDISIIQGGGIKTVWKIKTSQKTLCLKRLRQTYDKVQFTVNAQIHIKSQGGNVPGVLINKKGEPIVQYNHQLFVLYEWLEGENLYFNKSSDLEAAIKGLAVFHIASKGYKHPEGSRESSKFGQWPDLYTSMKNRLEEWRYIASTNDSGASHNAYLNCADGVIDIADLTLEFLDKSQYKNLAIPDSNLKILCHQDFGVGNVISTSEGVIVLDLDSVTFDFLVRDLRKVIGKLAEKTGEFDAALMNTIIGWYSSVNPIDVEERKLLYIDLLFPHWFHGLVKNQYIKNKLISPSEIEEIAQFEKDKFLKLKELLN